MLRHHRSAIRGIFSTQTAIWALLAAGLALSSAAWALEPAQSIKVGLSFAGLAVFGLIMLYQAANQSAAEAKSTYMALVAGMSIAVALLAVGTFYGLMYDQPLWGKENQHPIRTLSHAQTVISIMIVPCIAILWVRDAKSKMYAAALALLTAVTFFNLEHGASNLAILAALFAFIIVRISGKIGFTVLCIGAVLVVVSMPFLLATFLPDQEALNAMIPGQGAWSSETHRFHMWQFVIDAISNGSLLLGYGADASRSFPGANQKIMWGIELMPLHPHNGALQVWLELGAIGTAVVATVLALIFRATKGMSNNERAVQAALLSAYIVPWLLSYGVWQSWWIALAWLTAVIGRSLAAPKAG